MEPSKLESLLLKIHDVGGIKFGQYKLKSGVISPIYIDIRSIVSFPEILNTLCELMWDKLKTASDGALLSQTDFLAGVPYTALPIASVLAMKHDIPMLIVRKERKAYGTGREVEGMFQAGQTCLIIEDVVVSGASILTTRARIQQEGLVVNTSIVFIDRDQGGVEHLAKHGLTLLKVTSMIELVNILLKYGRIDASIRDSVLEFVKENQQEPTVDSQYDGQADSTGNGKVTKFPTLTFSARAGLAKSEFSKQMFRLMDEKKTNLCVAADVSSTSKLLALAETLGPEICMLKTHIDMLEDFTPDFPAKLAAIAEKHRFMIFEDRRFSDSETAVKQQYTKGLYKIDTWAHLTDAHLVLSSVKALSEACVARMESTQSGPRGILLIGQLGSEDMLSNDSQAKSVAESLTCTFQRAAAGYICNSRFSEESGVLYCTAGVHITKSDDQTNSVTYRTPEDAILENWCDVIIVGREITEAQDPTASAKQYRVRAWSAHIAKVSTQL